MKGKVYARGFATLSLAAALLGLASFAAMAQSSGVTVGGLATSNAWTGSNTFSGASAFTGHVRVARRTASGTIAASSTTDYEICADTTGGPATINLYAAPTNGDQLVITDCRGNAALNNITIVPNTGTIAGSASLVLNANFKSVGLTFNGTQAQWDVH